MLAVSPAMQAVGFGTAASIAVPFPHGLLTSAAVVISVLNERHGRGNRLRGRSRRRSKVTAPAYQENPAVRVTA